MVALGTIYSNFDNMKCLQINSAVNLTSGLSIPSGSVCVIAEGYADIKAQKDGVIPAQIATFLFVSETAISEGKSPITDVADFNPVFSGLSLSVSKYETDTAEALLVGAVYDALEAIYPGNVEVITI